MRVPVKSLEHAQLNIVDDIGVERAAHVLTMAGLEVEDIVDSAAGPVFVTKVTPNRGDWLSLNGVGRELAAALQGELPPVENGDMALPQLAGEAFPVRVFIEKSEWCQRYAAAVVDYEPFELDAPFTEELTATGVRPISTIVDITNWLMITTGQPLHAFDLDKLSGPEIVVRAARLGETIVTLDGVERVLDPSILVIADSDKPVAIAGIMGGKNSEVTPETRRVLIESAHFDPMAVRAASKKLGLTTDASYRFERFVDPGANLLFTLKEAADWIGGIGEQFAAPVYFDGGILGGGDAVAQTAILVRDSRAAEILGVAPSVVRSVDEALKTLGFTWDEKAVDSRAFQSPSWRNDIHREIDVIEEIGRMIGYDKLPETLPPARSTHGGGHDSPEGLLIGRARSVLMGQGLTEVYSHTLAAQSAFDDPGATERRVKIRSALSAELSGLRQSLVPGLLETLARNARLRNPEIALFEVGSVFWTPAGGEYEQGLRAAVAVQGDYMHARGVAENLLAGVGVEFPDVAAHVHPGMHPSRSARLTLRGQEIGFIAEADPDMMAEHLDLPPSFGRVGCFEIDLDAALAHHCGPVSYYPLPKYPEVTRDLAMVFDADAPYGTIERVARLAAGEYLESVSLVSIYTGERVEVGRKSVALRFTLRAQDRTLTDADADDALAAAQAALAENLGGSLR